MDSRGSTGSIPRGFGCKLHPNSSSSSSSSRVSPDHKGIAPHPLPLGIQHTEFPVTWSQHHRAWARHEPCMLVLVHSQCPSLLLTLCHLMDRDLWLIGMLLLVVLEELLGGWSLTHQCSRLSSHSSSRRLMRFSNSPTSPRSSSSSSSHMVGSRDQGRGSSRRISSSRQRLATNPHLLPKKATYVFSPGLLQAHCPSKPLTTPSL